MRIASSHSLQVAGILAAALIFGASSPLAQNVDRLLFDIAGSSGGFAVSGSGEWFIKNDSSVDHIWTHMGNLFAASGVGANGRVVCGIATYSTWGLFVVCEDGSFFVKNATPTKDAAAKDHVWAYGGNVFESASRFPPGGATISSFVAHESAGADLVLSNGDWYNKADSIDPLGWTYLGNIYTMAGIVPAEAKSHGSIKRVYR